MQRPNSNAGDSKAVNIQLEVISQGDYVNDDSPTAGNRTEYQLVPDDNTDISSVSFPARVGRSLSNIVTRVGHRLGDTWLGGKILKGTSWIGERVENFIDSSKRSISQHPGAFFIAVMSSLQAFVYTLLKPSGMTPEDAGKDLSSWWASMNEKDQAESVYSGIASFFINTLFGTIYNIMLLGTLKTIYNNFSLRTKLGQFLACTAVFVGLSAATAAGVLTMQALVAAGFIIYGTVGILNGIANCATRFAGATGAGDRCEIQVDNCLSSNKDKSLSAEYRQKNDKTLSSNFTKILGRLDSNIKKNISNALRQKAITLRETQLATIENEVLATEVFKKQVDAKNKKRLETYLNPQIKHATEEEGARSASAKRRIINDTVEKFLKENKDYPQYQELIVQDSIAKVKKTPAFQEEVATRLKKLFIASALEHEIPNALNEHKTRHPNDSIFQKSCVAKSASGAQSFLAYGIGICMALTSALIFAPKGRDFIKATGGKSYPALMGVGSFLTGFANSLFYFLIGLDSPEILRRGCVTVRKHPFSAGTTLATIVGAVYVARNSLTSVGKTNMLKEDWIAPFIQEDNIYGQMFLQAIPAAVMIANGAPITRHLLNQPEEVTEGHDPVFHDLILMIEKADLSKKDIKKLYIRTRGIEEFGNHTTAGIAFGENIGRDFYGLFNQPDDQKHPLRVALPSTADLSEMRSPTYSVAHGAGFSA